MKNPIKERKSKKKKLSKQARNDLYKKNAPVKIEFEFCASELEQYLQDAHRELLKLSKQELIDREIAFRTPFSFIEKKTEELKRIFSLFLELGFLKHRKLENNLFLDSFTEAASKLEKSIYALRKYSFNEGGGFRVTTKNNLWVDIHCLRTDIEYYADSDFLNEYTEIELKQKLLVKADKWRWILLEIESAIEKQNADHPFFYSE